MNKTEFQTALDRKDFALLQALQENGSQRLEDLARLVNLAPSSVHERLQRLQREGVIRRWTVEVNPSSLGSSVVAFVGVRATRPCSELLSSLRDLPWVEECHSVAGDLSMILKVRVATTDNLLELSERLRQIPGIEQTETTIVLKTHVDRQTALQPFAPEKDARERKR